MGTKKRQMDYILDQIEIEPEGYITYTKVYGKYAFTFNGTIFAQVIDSRLYLKATKGGKDYIGAGSIVKGIPFKNADTHYVIGEEQYDDSPWFSKLIEITVTELGRAKKGAGRIKEA